MANYDISLKGRDFLRLLDFTPDELNYLIELGHEFKRLKKKGTVSHFFEGKNIVLLFEKTSTRTRCAFEVAARDLGLGVTYLDPGSSQMGAKESIRDTARVLGRMFEGIEYRGYGQQIVDELAAYAGVPVWNGLTTEAHPTQMLADAMTLQENFGPDLRGRKLVFMGDAGNNVGNSLMVLSAKLGLDFVACGPENLMPDAALIEECQAIARNAGGSVAHTSNVRQACTGAHAIYTDIWVSMGEPDALWAPRIRELTPYRVDAQVMSYAADDAIFMHCLPSFHDTNTVVGAEIARRFGITEMEVTDEVFESDRSRVFDEAENRMHSIKAVIFATLSDYPWPSY